MAKKRVRFQWENDDCQFWYHRRATIRGIELDVKLSKTHDEEYSIRASTENLAIWGPGPAGIGDALNEAHRLRHILEAAIKGGLKP